jgi:hypothetical protein
MTIVKRLYHGHQRKLLEWPELKKNETIGITTRDIENYQANINKIPLNATFQYVEIRAGLGQFIPFLIETLNDELSKRPIVLDPANYSLMIKIMEDHRDLALRMGVGNRLEEIIKRARMINDSSRVQLIRRTLRGATDENPGLIGCADVLVESWGPSLYTYMSDNELREIELKEALVKQGGISVGC